MKFYLNKKDNELIIVASKDEKCLNVVFVKDRGTNPHKRKNIFGQQLERYRYHWSSIDEGYSTQTDKIDWINKEDQVHFYKVQKTKKKIKV